MLCAGHRIATFALVYILYAVAVARPGHGSIGPLALGLTIFALISAGELPSTIYARSGLLTHARSMNAFCTARKLGYRVQVCLMKSAQLSWIEDISSAMLSYSVIEPGPWVIRRWALAGHGDQPCARVGQPHRVPVHQQGLDLPAGSRFWRSTCIGRLWQRLRVGWRIQRCRGDHRPAQRSTAQPGACLRCSCYLLASVDKYGGLLSCRTLLE